MDGKIAEKLLDDVDELFVGKPTWTSETKTVGLEIPKFLKKIEEEETVTSPRFKISEVEFYIKVSPGNDDPEFVSVDVLTGSEEPPTTSVSFLEGTGAMASWKMREIKKGGLGCGKFLPHQRFKAWAKNHGDVFKLKATITLHQKGNTTVVDWIRYCNPCLFLDLVLIHLRRRQPGKKLRLPESLRSETSTSALNKAIMLDESTADFTVRCETKSFKVHKSFLCSRLVKILSTILII